MMDGMRKKTMESDYDWDDKPTCPDWDSFFISALFFRQTLA